MTNATSVLSVLSKRIFFVGTCLACMLAFALATLQAEAIHLTAQESTTSGWSEFSPNFDPTWWGETKRINWRRTYTSSSGIMVSYNFLPNSNIIFVVPQVPPIELLDSTRSISSASVAEIDVPGEHARAEKSSNPTTSDDGESNMTSAHFAEVIDLDDLVLGKGNSLASLVSDVSDTSYSFVNRIAAGSSIDPIVNRSSLATGDASTDFAASYQLHVPASFELSGSFAAAADVDVSFAIADRNSDTVVYEQSLTSFDSTGEELRFSVLGELAPSIYDVIFSSNSSSKTTPSGVEAEGGLGEFSVDFRMQPTDPSTPMFLSTNSRTGGPLFGEGNTTLYEPNIAVPEPSTVALLMAAHLMAALLLADSLISRPVAASSIGA